MEANFNELIQRQTSLEEVRAYVLLRQSSLSAEDKKKILLEHGGKLSYRQVVSSYRLLGSKFFQEVQSGRPAQKTKVYDVNFVEEPDSGGPTMDPPEKVIMLTQEDPDPELDTEFLEAMVAMEDQDALTISAFESELEEFLQDTPELFEAFVSYQEARQKLLDKKRNRGFWPPRGGKKGFKGRGKGGKGHRREQLLARIARSSCRHCGEKGHWRAECPQRLKESSGTNAAANVAQSEVTEIPSTELLVPSEHDEIFTEEELRLAEAMGCESQFSSECLSSSKVTQNESTVSPLHNSVADALMSMSLGVTKIFGFNNHKNRQCPARRMSNHMSPQGYRSVRLPAEPNNRKVSQPTHTESANVSPDRQHRSVLNRKPEPVRPTTDAFVVSCPAKCDETCAILDTGASRCVIGSKILEVLLQRLPKDIRRAVMQKPSQVKFRFGNNQTLTSKYRVYFPMYSSISGERLWLGVEVVEGRTPFLFSKRAFKQLGGILDTTQDQCTLARLQKSIKLRVNATGLYLLDVIEFCSNAEPPVSQTTPDFVGLTSHVGVNHDKLGLEQNSLSQCRNTNRFRFRKSDSHQLSVKSRSFKFGHQECRDSFSPGSTIEPCDPIASVPSDRAICHANSQRDRSGLEEPGQSGHERADDVAPSECADDRRRDAARVHRSEASPGTDVWPTGPAEDVPPESDRPTTGSNQCDSQPDRPSKPASHGEAPRRFKTSWKSQSAGSVGKPSVIMHRKPWKFDARARRRWIIGRVGNYVRHRRSTSCSTQSANGDARPFKFSAKCDSWKHLHPGVGSEEDHMGQETSRTLLCRDFPSRSRISEMVQRSIQQPHAGAAGVCGLLPTEVGDRCRVLDARNNASREDFQRKVESCKLDLSRCPAMQLSQKQKQDIFSSFQQVSNIANQVFSDQRVDASHVSIDLLEVYAGQHSPLTEAVIASGGTAIRFTKEDGDLSTPAGRRKLWQVIDQYQPRNIFVAPECGPWNGWSHLNSQKSVAMFDYIQFRREQELIHLRLCKDLCA